MIRRKQNVEPGYMSHCAAFPSVCDALLGVGKLCQLGAYYDVASDMFVVFHAGQELQDVKSISIRKGEKGWGLYCGWSVQYYRSHPVYHDSWLNAYLAPFFPWRSGKSCFTKASGGQLMFDTLDKWRLQPIGYRSFADTCTWLYSQYQIIDLRYYEEV